MESLIKNHSPHAKDRTNVLSHQLIEKRVFISLVNRDIKEFQLRWQHIVDEANKKIRLLDSALADIQGWEKRLSEFKEWNNYMEKYMTSRVDKDIFADDVPDDAQRILDEFKTQEYVLRDLEETLHRYQVQNKFDASVRLEQQMGVARVMWTDSNNKLKKFQKPSDFDIKLQKLKNQLDEIDATLQTIGFYSEDIDIINMQLEHCMVTTAFSHHSRSFLYLLLTMFSKKIYKTLSELKGEVEAVLKQGRGIVDKQQVENTQELTSQLDNLKLKYNDLGSRVTNGKNDIERAHKCSKKFRKEFNLINDFLSKIDNELKKIELKPLSKNYTDELDWIKNTRFEINKVETNVETLKNLYKILCEMAKNKENQLTGALNKVKDIEEKLSSIIRRLDNRSCFIQVS